MSKFKEPTEYSEATSILEHARDKALKLFDDPDSLKTKIFNSDSGYMQLVISDQYEMNHIYIELNVNGFQHATGYSRSFGNFRGMSGTAQNVNKAVKDFIHFFKTALM